MPKGMPSQADVELAVELNERGVTVRRRAVSASQVQSWRSRGLVSAALVGRGGRRGLTASNPPNALEEATQTAEFLTQFNNLNYVVLAVFGLGRDPAELALRRAYADLIDRAARGLEKADKALDDPSRLTRYTEELAALLRWMDPRMFASFDAATRQSARAQRIDPVTGAEERTTSRMNKEASFADLNSLFFDGDITAAKFAKPVGMDRFMGDIFGDSPDQVAKALDFPIYTPSQLAERLSDASYETLKGMRNMALSQAGLMDALGLSLLESVLTTPFQRGYTVAQVALSSPPLPAYTPIPTTREGWESALTEMGYVRPQP